jgi:hypothetical protein
MNKKDRFIESARQHLLYTLSLPERTIRSLAALAGGTTSLLTEMLFPESLRETTIYNVSFGMMQRFIIEKVAGIESEFSEGQTELGDDYVQRKMAGTALEAAGLLAMRFSPLWVFAIAGDAAGGSKVFLKRLVKHLKENNIIAQETEAAELVDVLEAVQEASSKSASSIDTPPLSREKLSELANEMKVNYVRVFKTTTNLIPNLDTIWENMEQLAHREKISIERLGGIITVDALSWSKKGVGVVFATGRTGVELFDEKILDSYRKTLAAVSEKGIDQYMSTHMQPFMRSAKSHFDPGQKTWLESKLESKRNTKRDS